MLRKNIIMLSTVVFVALLTLNITSCNRDVFDSEEYNQIVRQLSPVDSIETVHTFKTTVQHSIAVDFAGIEGTRRIQVLSANPAVAEACYILAETYVTNATQATLSFTAPAGTSLFYAALVNADGKYTIARFNASQEAVSFSQPEVTDLVPRRAPVPQVFTYCYEDEQPEAGDYDYNDLVLRISQQRTGEKELSLNVTVAAVGSDNKLAAAIRLVGCNPELIDSVYTMGEVRGETFDDGLKEAGQAYIENSEQIQPSRQGEAVLRIFEDAHWATGDPNLSSDFGVVDRLHYNVARMSSDTDELISPRTITYHIVFKDTSYLEGFTMEQLDPFVMEEYNSGIWEVHIGDYQGEQVLHEYTLVTTVKLLPWALAVPTGAFRYPLQGYNIGYRKNGHLFGAYMTSGHSFGEWVENHLQSIDWYEYPTLNMVF